MNVLRQIIMALIGLSAGAVTSAGVFALITIVGIVPRLAGRSNTASHVKLYETAILMGGAIGNAIDLYGKNLNGNIVWLSSLGLAVFGISSGIFVGCLVMSLSEVLDSVPITSRRLKISMGMAYLVLGIALGKAVGAIVFFYSGW